MICFLLADKVRHGWLVEVRTRKQWYGVDSCERKVKVGFDWRRKAMVCVAGGQ